MPTPSECGSNCGVSSTEVFAIAEERDVAAARDLACETLYRCLAAALSNPDSAAWSIADDESNLIAARLAMDYLREQFEDVEIPLGFGESALERLDVRPLFGAWPVDAASAMAEYARVFGFAGSRECSPYETEYHPNEEVFFRSQQMADVAGFYRAFGLNVSPERHDRVDHITLELEFAAFLLMKKRLADRAAGECDGAATVVQEARKSFLKDHLCWWAPSFSIALRRKASGGFYAAAADVLSALLPLERHRLGVAPPLMPLEARTDDASDAASGCEGCALARD